MAKLIAERDAALPSAKRWRGKKFGRGSERNAGHGDELNGGAGENREAEKSDFVNPEVQAKKDAGKTSATTEDGETVDVAKEMAKLKRRHHGAEVSVERVDYSKVASTCPMRMCSCTLLKSTLFLGKANASAQRTVK